MTKLKATELWDALDDAGVDAEIEAALAKTPEEHRRELVAAGFTLDEVDAKADALFASLLPPEPIAATAPVASEAPSVPMAKPRRVRTAVVVPLALALAAGIAVVIKAALSPVPVASPQTESHAHALRCEAKDACDAQQWDTCLEKLDEARRLDPEGDGAPGVQEMRRRSALPERHTSP